MMSSGCMLSCAFIPFGRAGIYSNTVACSFCLKNNWLHTELCDSRKRWSYAVFIFSRSQMLFCLFFCRVMFSRDNLDISMGSKTPTMSMIHVIFSNWSSVVLIWSHVQHGANIMYTEDVLRLTPFHAAAAGHHSSCVDYSPTYGSPPGSLINLVCRNDVHAIMLSAHYEISGGQQL